MSVSKYLDYFKYSEANQGKLLSKEIDDISRDHDLRNSLILTWQLSFEQIQDQHPQASDLLALMSTLDRHSIPKKILCLDDEDEMDFDEAVSVLINFSLISAEIEEDTFSMHRLVSLTTQIWLAKNNLQGEWRGKALNRLDQAVPDGYNHDSSAEFESLYPHVHLLLSYTFEDLGIQRARTDLSAKIAIFDREMARYDTACSRLKIAVQFREAEYGPEDYRTLLCLDQLALALGGQAKYIEALEIIERVRQIREKSLGVEDPLYLTSCMYTGNLLGDMSRYWEAESWQRKALEGREILYGAKSNNESCLASNNNLANTLQELGQYEEAKEMHTRALEGWQQIHGVEHPWTSGAM